jgi:hypothetical protein
VTGYNDLVTDLHAGHLCTDLRDDTGAFESDRGQRCRDSGGTLLIGVDRVKTATVDFPVDWIHAGRAHVDHHPIHRSAGHSHFHHGEHVRIAESGRANNSWHVIDPRLRSSIARE